MKIAAVLISLIGTASAAPALIWKKSAGVPTKHSSKQIDARRLIASTVKSTENADVPLSTVFFLVGRDENGDEALSHLTSSGLLPNVSSKYDDIHTIHYHVDGIESANKVAQDAMKGLKTKEQDGRVVESSLTEFYAKLKSIENDVSIAEEAEVLPSGQIVSKTKKQERKRDRALDKAEVLVVNVPYVEHEALDSAVSEAILSSSIDNVVLAGIRSHEEVKRERSLAARQRFQRMTKVNGKGRQNRRRLEDAQDDDAADDDAAQDEEGTYYVYMTPNILAGILFILFFVGVAYTGISCMGMISGQDVYVTKYPAIGREA